MQTSLNYPLDPTEWDFRGLDPTQFRVALSYELGREQPEVSEALALLTAERRRQIEALGPGDWDDWRPEWVEEHRFWKLFDSFWLCWCCQDFPKPWMSLPDTARAGAVERYGEPLAPVRILTREDLTRIEHMAQMVAEALKNRIRPGETEGGGTIRRYIVEIDWSRDDPVLKPKLLGLLKLRPEGTRPRKHHTGRAAAVKLHCFRRLAAWRLATKAGLRHKDAQQVIARRQAEFSQPDPFDLLPNYASAGAWKDAVDAGRRLVKRGV
jgi:hypothetical protein